MDLEVAALVNGLESMSRFISGCKTHLMTDSRVLYYLFSQKISNSAAKVRNWRNKVSSDFPLLILHFIRSASNFADFLTREGMKKGDVERFNVKDVNISDFTNDLPKDTFTLAEWIYFVNTHPEYLTINRAEHLPTKVKAICNALTLNKITSPLEILEKRLSRAEIVAHQRAEMPDLYEKCVKAGRFECSENENNKVIKYRLLNGLLMIQEGEHFQIFMPPSMVGLLLSYTHLLAHKGLTRMLADMQLYYFKNKYTVTKRFVQSCYSCFLSQTGTKKVEMGRYPVPTHAFEEVSADLAENLNPNGGYSHLLIVRCYLSDFILIFPLKTKTNKEISTWLTYGLQAFPIKRLHSDNAPGLRDLNFLQRMSIRGITVINSSAQNPSARGYAEAAVKQVKLCLKRFLVVFPKYSWELIISHVAYVLNSAISPRTGFSPFQMVFGQHINLTNLEAGLIAKPHYMVRNAKTYLEENSKELSELAVKAKLIIEQNRILTIDKLNKTRISSDLKPYDYVFTKDRSEVQGAPRPLKTKLSESVYIVLKKLNTTAVIKRLGDGMSFVYSLNDLKKYRGGSPLFQNLPDEVKSVLVYKFQDLLKEDFLTLTKFDNFEIKPAIELYDTESSSTEEDKNDGNDQKTKDSSLLEAESDSSETEEEDEETLPRLRPRANLRKTVRFS